MAEPLLSVEDLHVRFSTLRGHVYAVNGAACFDERYLANPLVYCGTVGLIPVDRCRKAAKAGDLIVAVGGRTGRDGIHGATFSSLGLHAESDEVSGGAVQIGNAIDEKKMLDIDLSILGAPWQDYHKYMQGVRKEWCPSVVSNAAFRVGRMEFLRSVLEAAPKRVRVTPS